MYIYRSVYFVKCGTARTAVLFAAAHAYIYRSVYLDKGDLRVPAGPGDDLSRDASGLAALEVPGGGAHHFRRKRRSARRCGRRAAGRRATAFAFDAVRYIL